MKITRSRLRELIVEEVANLHPRGRLSDSSIDDQIDSLLIKFEEESQAPEEEEAYVEARSHISLSLLMEAEPGEEDEEMEGGDDPLPGEAPAPDEEPESDLTTDSTESEIDEPSEPGRPKLDIDHFAGRVARFLSHYDSLLDIETVIINRTMQYLVDNYDQTVAEEFETTLDEQFGVSLEPSDNEPEIPAAAGAGPSVG